MRYWADRFIHEDGGKRKCAGFSVSFEPNCQIGQHEIALLTILLHVTKTSCVHWTFILDGGWGRQGWSV